MANFGTKANRKTGKTTIVQPAQPKRRELGLADKILFKILKLEKFPDFKGKQDIIKSLTKKYGEEANRIHRSRS